MEYVKFMILLLLIVVCDSSCPSTWYTIPGNRCIKVIKTGLVVRENLDSTMCEKYTIGTKVASYFSVTSPNEFAILDKFKSWIYFVYLDWNYVGSTYYYNNGSMVDIHEYSLEDDTDRGGGNCVVVNLVEKEVDASCLSFEVGYVCEIKL
ncbi:uncharacterized protein LOC117111385 [Anneissia japonica]|uniref:uncharacterized protein LOC117111385 n=1 Tax=Anneissia japonica TaxID=1529436 RepID=UPI0014258E9D|nr:uncharacterized protein LOC117111385 [Anneissia japonica]